jgi:dTDP-4-dehydrorhamnose reductase
MRILVTGASGLLGLNVALAAAPSHQVVGQVNGHPIQTDAFTVETADFLAPGSLERLLDRVQPDWIIHCAALALVDECEREPARAQELNSELPRRLAEHVARGGARLLHVSTDAVFDGQRGDYDETDLPNPLSVYARTKLQGEEAVAAANPAAIIARVNLFGWSLSGTRSLAEFFVNRLRAGQPCQGFTDVHFCPLHAPDLGHLLLDLLASGAHGLYHVVSADCLSKYAFGVAVAEAFGLDAGLIAPVSVTAAGLSAARSPNLTLRTAKLARQLGRTPPTVAQGIASFRALDREGFPARLRALRA